MGKIDDIKTEIDADPLARGYSGMDDAAVAADLNTVYRDAPADPTALLNYCILEDYRGESVYGRIEAVADSKPGDSLPLGDSDAPHVLSMKMITAAKAFRRFLQPDVQATEALTSSGWDNVLQGIAGGATNAQCIGPTQKSAIQALSQNRQSRATELGLGRVRTGDVQQARAL